MFSKINRLPNLINLSSCREILAANTSIGNNSLKYASTVNRCLSSLNQLIENRSKFDRQTKTASYTDIRRNFQTTGTITNTIDEDRKSIFMQTFPDILRDLDQISDKYNRKEISQWFQEVLKYNVPYGKHHRGLLTVSTFERLVKPEDLTPNNLRLANILGWCVEIYHAFCCMADDVMDGSTTRRGRPCWYKLPNVGLIAINDSLMVENCLYLLLEKYFDKHECYIQLMKLFHDISFITICGQSQDLLSTTKTAESFTMENHLITTLNKTVHYSFILPFVAAMHLAGIKDPKAFHECRMILKEIGVLYQIQDDFIDGYGNPDQSGKIGTDIQENKNSWLAVQCMQRANEEQKQIMLECYGKKDPENVQKVKDIYDAMDLPKLYASYEEETYNKIKSQIQQMKSDLPPDMFLNLLKSFHKRIA